MSGGGTHHAVSRKRNFQFVFYSAPKRSRLWGHTPEDGTYVIGKNKTRKVVHVMVLVQCAEYTFTIIFFYMIILVNLSVYLTLCEGQVIFPPRALCRNASVPGCIMQDDFTWRGPDRGIAGPACTTTCLRCGAGGRGCSGQRRHGRGREGIGWPGEG